ncbi:MAG: alkylation response protein AidB-like acyl-CoA dehydrogenase [Halieaceae bacterium]
MPHMEQWRDAGIVDREAFRKAGERGFLMVWPEEKYGGMGDSDFRFEQVIIEETAYARVGDWFSTLHSRLVGPYFTRFGSEEQCQRFLPKCVTGETILAIAMTEPDAGSDLAGMRSTAVRQGDHWVLNGSKTYISNGINADLVIVAAKTDPDNNPHAMTLFVVERGMPGFERGRNLKKMGLKAQDTSELFFNDVSIPDANVIGEPGKGFIYLMEGLAEERLIGAAGYLASAQLSWDLTAAYVRERKAFGKPLAAFQNTQFKLAELRTELDLAQSYVDQCVAAFNGGALTAVDAAKAKLVTSELQVKAADVGVQLHGGAGYMDEYPISRQCTDAKIATIYAGSSEVMKIIISRDCLSDNYSPFNTRNF